MDVTLNDFDFENKILKEKKIYFNHRGYTHELLYNLLIQTYNKYNKFLLDIKKYIMYKNKKIKNTINEKNKIIKEKDNIIDELSHGNTVLKMTEEDYINEINDCLYKNEQLTLKIKDNDEYYNNLILFIGYLFLISTFYTYVIGAFGFNIVMYNTYYIFILTPIQLIIDISGIIFDAIIINNIFNVP
tara:strand:- start:591 stop:1151 length:561 start_codon:yes stop_codon:yes gene_type:complete